MKTNAYHLNYCFMPLNIKLSLSLFAAIFFFFPIFSLSAEEARITPEDIASIKQVVQTEIHPEGTYVAYTLRKPRGEEDAVGRDYLELWIMDLETGESTGVVAAPESASSPAWIPESNRLAFRAVDTLFHALPQVYSVDVSGNTDERKPHTSAPEGILSFRFSPNGSHVVYTMREAWPDDVAERRRKGFDMEVSGENERHVRLRLEKNGKNQALTPGDMNVWDYAWSPDNQHLAVRVSAGTGPDDDLMFSQIKKINIYEKKMELLAESQGKVGEMAFSPDGKQFAFLAAKAINDPLPQRIYVTDVNSYMATDITPDGYEGTPEWLGWVDSRAIRFLAVEGTRTVLREIPASGGPAEILVGGGLECYRSISFDASLMRFAAPVHRRDHPAELYIATLPGPEWKRMTHHNAFLNKRKLGRQETIEWLSYDGLRVEGVLTYPVNFREGERYPLTILPHGGPEGVSIDGWNTRPLYPAQLLASEGYVVLKPNYRGSGGRGSHFTMANHRDLGGKEFEDVLSGIDYLSYRGIIDPQKTGISGTSYGGYFSAWAATRHTERFAAAITFAGLSNWISFMGTTDIPHEMSITHWDFWWFENEGINWDRSPTAHLQRASTPVLVAHGLADVRVHPEQSMQLYQFLKLHDIPAQLVMYPRQPHGLTERAHRIDFMGRIVDWFEKYVK